MPAARMACMKAHSATAQPQSFPVSVEDCKSDAVDSTVRPPTGHQMKEGRGGNSDKTEGSSHLVDFRCNQGPGQEEDEGAAQGEARQRGQTRSEAATTALKVAEETAPWLENHSRLYIGRPSGLECSSMHN